ncbi:MAG: acyltransferase [Alphaproteobacteria bacterium]|nr:acyltransferase [Alphaproteobacteria bacterium]
MPRGNNLDALRLIFAWLVVLAHANELPGYGSASPLFHASGLAVDGFFVLSGFLVFKSWVDRPDPRAYALRRFFRIWPAYATVVLAQCVLLMALQPALPAAEAGRYLAANAIFLNFLAPSIGPLLDGLPLHAINGALWTLKIEAGFYLVLPVLAWAILRRPKLTLAVLVLASLAWVTLWNRAGGPAVLMHQLPGKMHLFALGIGLALWRDRVGTPVLALGATVAAALPWLIPLDPTMAQVQRALLLAFALPLIGFRLPAVRLPLDISYGVYLVHFPLIQMAVLHGWTARMTLAETTAAVAAATLGLALILNLAIERPMIRLGRHLARRTPLAVATPVSQ